MKLLPTLSIETDPDTAIITVDDDVEYPPQLVEKLVKSIRPTPGPCNRVYRLERRRRNIGLGNLGAHERWRRLRRSFNRFKSLKEREASCIGAGFSTTISLDIQEPRPSAITTISSSADISRAAESPAPSAGLTPARRRGVTPGRFIARIAVCTRPETGLKLGWDCWDYWSTAQSEGIGPPLRTLSSADRLQLGAETCPRNGFIHHRADPGVAERRDDASVGEDPLAVAGSSLR
jgi:hypothetical protein